MVENKKASSSNYEESPPLVEAHPVNQEEEYSVPPASHHHNQNQASAPPEHQVAHSSKQIQHAAGLASGILGLFMGGPILAIVAGLGGSHASKKDGLLGDAARMLGETALNFKEKFWHFDSKHKLYDQATNTADQAWQKARTYDQKYNILEKSKNLALVALKYVYDKALQYNILDHGSDKLGGLVYNILVKVATLIPGISKSDATKTLDEGKNKKNTSKTVKQQ